MLSARCGMEKLDGKRRDQMFRPVQSNDRIATTNAVSIEYITPKAVEKQHIVVS